MTVPTPSCVVAPAELEGHLLGHPDVGDVCVVGIPDDYSGEVPLAFVVPSHAAQEKIKTDPSESDKAKASIIKVGTNFPMSHTDCIECKIFDVIDVTQGRCKVHKIGSPRNELHSFAFAGLFAAISFAFSRKKRLSSFPLGFLGMMSTNSTPPAKRL